MSLTRREAALGAASLAAGALTPAIAQPAFARKLVLEEFFRGRLSAEGEFVNTRDGSRRGLVVAMRGSWDTKAQTLTLVEDFVYSDGEKDRKTWVFRKLGEGRYSGTREDVVGEADIVQDGDDVLLDYRARIATAGGSAWTIRFKDRLAMTGPSEVLNTAQLSWLFFEVGRVRLVMRKIR